MDNSTSILNQYLEYTNYSSEKVFTTGEEFFDTSMKDLQSFKPKYIDSEKGIEGIRQDTSLTVFDVAAYILARLPEQSCTTMKLHKLLYYSQAWSLVWDEKPLFNEKIEAWANGPVIPELFYYHKGLFTITLNNYTQGNSSRLSQNQKNTVNSVLEFYGNKTAQWLIDLTHLEEPWKEARKGLGINERSNRVIELASIAEYYSSL